MSFPLIQAQSGYIEQSTEKSREQTAGKAVTGGEIRVGSTVSQKQIRGLVSFDTSTLDEHAYVTHAVLRLHHSNLPGKPSDAAIGPAYVDINRSNGFGGDLKLSAGDFDARADAVEVAKLSQPSAGQAWSEGTLDALGRRGIHHAGTNQFRLYRMRASDRKKRADSIAYDTAELVVTYELRPPIDRSISLIAPDEIRGLRTKWEKYFGGKHGATRASIQPEMRGLTHTQWAQAIEHAGANACTINVEARNQLLRQAKHSLDALSPSQISKGQFTPDQRNTAQMRFLLGLEEAREAGTIEGSFRFHAHQRLYPNGLREKEADFVKDFAGFINCARALRLDHWIRGIRLGENGIDTNQLNYSMKLAIQWATEINAETDDWLKSNGMEIHGAKMGLFFNDIDKRSNSRRFFEQIAAETGYFAWCFKFFHHAGLEESMEAAGYNASNAKSLKAYLNKECGFADLEAFIRANRPAYPMHANCLFVGDSGDAMKQIGTKKLQALSELFTQAGSGFSGIVAVNAYSWERENEIGNQYKAIFKVDPTGSLPELNPASHARWQAWPNID